MHPLPAGSHEAFSKSCATQGNVPAGDGLIITRPEHPSSQSQGLQASMQGQELSDLSQRCHPTPEHTQHRAEESTSPLSPAQSCLAPWLEEPPPAPGAPAGSSKLAANIQRGQQATVSISQ